MSRKLYIRPVYVDEVLKSYALTTTNGIILSDSQVLDHFDTDHNGKMIKESAKEFHDGEADWGKPINNETPTN